MTHHDFVTLCLNVYVSLLVYTTKKSTLYIFFQPYLWWVHQTSIVYIHQSASCELWLWLVRLDWYLVSICCHLLTQMLRT